MRACCAAIPVLLGILIAVVHHSPPYLSTRCTLGLGQCPQVKHATTGKHQGDKADDILNRIKQSITHWIDSGEEIASQLSIRRKGEEIFNFYAADTVRTGNRFDERSLVTIFSNGKTFEAMFMAMAVEQKWISSYDDPITKYWRRFPTNRKKYDIRISDVLRHEAGLCIYQRYRIVFDLWNINIASYELLRKAIEDEKITFWEDQSGVTRKRCYHTISRGHILNEIFHLVEPQGRYMAQFYEQEILPRLAHHDPGYGLTFRGLRYVQHLQNTDGSRSVWDENRMFDVESPSTLWTLYHHHFAKYILKRPIVADEDLKAKMCGHLEDASLCPDQSFNVNQTLFDRALQDFYEMKEHNDYSPKFLGGYFRMMLIEHTSTSTMANAYSMTLLFQWMMEHLVSKETKELMFGEVTTDFDIALGAESSFSVGGFGRFEIGGVEWFGWSGWGGSTMLYAPQYDCYVAYLVTGFRRKDVAGDYRKFVVTNLISQFLTKE